jgi:DNA replication and repair protein RecF
VRLTHLWLRDFRNYQELDLKLAPAGLTLVLGDNGEGKTNVLEAIAYLATLSSFRRAPKEALVRRGADSAIIRAEGEEGGRRLLVEAQLNRVGRDRILVNRAPLRNSRELLGTLRVTVFSPDDLELVKGPPAGRRRYLDDLLVALHPRNQALLSDVERILRQRGALLRQAGGRLTAEVTTTLDVWDRALLEKGGALTAAREALVTRLEPEVAKAYNQLAPSGGEVRLVYERSWEADLAQGLAAARAEDVRHGVTSVGPHRDELALAIAGLPARTHASQGEQRSLALALRLASHALVTGETTTPPVLLLDDVFSELDSHRSRSLVAHLPAGQSVLTSAAEPPPGLAPTWRVRVSAGKLEE